MIYAFGFIGFVAGFAIGQMLLYFMLRHRSPEELINDRSLRWTYGIVNWACAIAGAYAFVVMYNQYYG